MMSDMKIRIFVKDLDEWPTDGVLRIDEWLKGEAAIMPEEACHHANDYLAAKVPLSVRADEPMLVLGEPSVWRMKVILRFLGIENVATVGTIDVNAMTGETIPLSVGEIKAMQDQVDEISRRLLRKTKAAS